MSAPPGDGPTTGELGSLRGGRYRVLGELGSGAQGQTLEAEDTSSGVRVAIKRFSVRGAKSWKDVELAEREADVLSRLTHPSLPRYLDHFEEDGALYLVMEKIEGSSLHLLRREGMSRAEVLRFLRGAAETLGYLHGRAPPLIHRDIKPSNVVLRPDGTFVLVDFGSVRDRLRPEGGSTVVGTFGYMAPEQFQGRALPATDVYGVGATAIACLTGEEPENLPHRGLAIDVPKALGGRAEPALVRLLSELLDPDPDRRPSDLARAIERHFPAGRAPESRRAARPGEPDLRGDLGWKGAGRGREWERYGREWERYGRMWERGWEDFRYGGRGRHGAGPIGPLLLLVAFVGLFIARFATFSLFRLFLPLLLGLLGLFFGKRLLRAARRMREIGRAGDAGLRHARDRLRALPSDDEPPPERPRVRLDDEELDEQAELDAEEDAEDWRSHDRRRRRR